MQELNLIIYRSYQFFVALKAWLFGLNNATDQASVINTILPLPAQTALFKRMSPNDQRHALAVAQTLRQAGYHNIALLQAALLHDVAKSLGQPIIYRVLIVLLEAIAPTVLAWLSFAPDQANLAGISWWSRPFAIHAHHPTIGAAWAKAAQCEPLAIRLIIRHQEKLRAIFNEEDHLLAVLQWADNLN